MTEREIIEAIKQGRSFMVTASGPCSAREDLLSSLQRFTNMAISEMRGDAARLESEVAKWQARLQASTDTCDDWMQEAMSLQKDRDRLREALSAAQGEAYLGTLDSDEVPTPLAACESVINVCLNALAPVSDASRDSQQGENA